MQELLTSQATAKADDLSPATIGAARAMCSLNGITTDQPPADPLASLSGMIPKLDSPKPRLVPACTEPRHEGPASTVPHDLVNSTRGTPSEHVNPTAASKHKGSASTIALYNESFLPKTPAAYEWLPSRMTAEHASSVPRPACEDRDSTTRTLLEDENVYRMPAPGTAPKLCGPPSRATPEHGYVIPRLPPKGDCFSNRPPHTSQKAPLYQGLPSRMTPEHEDSILGMTFDDEDSTSSIEYEGFREVLQGHAGHSPRRASEREGTILGMALEEKDTALEDESIMHRIQSGPTGRAPRRAPARRDPSSRKTPKGKASSCAPAVGNMPGSSPYPADIAATMALEHNCYLYKVASKYFNHFRTPVHLAFPRIAPDSIEASSDEPHDSLGVVHECHLCPFSTKFKRDLVQHVWSHTGEKPYKCNSCDYSARSISHLVVHQRTHTGEKPYKCSECSYATIRKSYLVIHQRKHTGERPFKCLFCSYATAAKWRLMVHLRTHTGERPYKCQFCDYTAAQKGNLMVHERNHTVLPA